MIFSVVHVYTACVVHMTNDWHAVKHLNQWVHVCTRLIAFTNNCFHILIVVQLANCLLVACCSITQVLIRERNVNKQATLTRTCIVCNTFDYKHVQRHNNVLYTEYSTITRRLKQLISTLSDYILANVRFEHFIPHPLAWKCRIKWLRSFLNDITRDWIC